MKPLAGNRSDHVDTQRKAQLGNRPVVAESVKETGTVDTVERKRSTDTRAQSHNATAVAPEAQRPLTSRARSRTGPGEVPTEISQPVSLLSLPPARGLEALVTFGEDPNGVVMKEVGLTLEKGGVAIFPAQYLDPRSPDAPNLPPELARAQSMLRAVAHNNLLSAAAEARVFVHGETFVAIPEHFFSGEPSESAVLERLGFAPDALEPVPTDALEKRAMAPPPEKTSHLSAFQSLFSDRAAPKRFAFFGHGSRSTSDGVPEGLISGLHHEDTQALMEWLEGNHCEMAAFMGCYTGGENSDILRDAAPSFPVFTFTSSDSSSYGDQGAAQFLEACRASFGDGPVTMRQVRQAMAHFESNVTLNASTAPSVLLPYGGQQAAFRPVSARHDGVAHATGSTRLFGSHVEKPLDFDAGAPISSSPGDAHHSIQDMRTSQPLPGMLQAWRRQARLGTPLLNATKAFYIDTLRCGEEVYRQVTVVQTEGALEAYVPDPEAGQYRKFSWDDTGTKSLEEDRPKETLVSRDEMEAALRDSVYRSFGIQRGHQDPEKYREEQARFLEGLQDGFFTPDAPASKETRAFLTASRAALQLRPPSGPERQALRDLSATDEGHVAELAARQGNVDLLQAMLPLQSAEAHTRILNAAARHGDAATMALLVEGGLQPDIFAREDPLFTAAFYGHSDAAAVLLTGSEPNTQQIKATACRLQLANLTPGVRDRMYAFLEDLDPNFFNKTSEGEGGLALASKGFLSSGNLLAKPSGNLLEKESLDAEYQARPKLDRSSERRTNGNLEATLDLDSVKLELTDDQLATLRQLLEGGF